METVIILFALLLATLFFMTFFGFIQMVVMETSEYGATHGISYSFIKARDEFTTTVFMNM